MQKCLGAVLLFAPLSVPAPVCVHTPGYVAVLVIELAVVVVVFVLALVYSALDNNRPPLGP